MTAKEKSLVQYIVGEVKANPWVMKDKVVFICFAFSLEEFICFLKNIGKVV